MVSMPSASPRPVTVEAGYAMGSAARGAETRNEPGPDAPPSPAADGQCAVSVAEWEQIHLASTFCFLWNQMQERQ